MIPLCSRFDSVLFTPKMSAIASYGNFSRSPNVYWDFKAAFDAAKLLLETTPAMLRHWDGLQWAPETRGG
jgi:hypothetical protein